LRTARKEKVGQRHSLGSLSVDFGFPFGWLVSGGAGRTSGSWMMRSRARRFSSIGAKTALSTHPTATWGLHYL
jgi:hypothetical protein